MPTIFEIKLILRIFNICSSWYYQQTYWRIQRTRWILIFVQNQNLNRINDNCQIFIELSIRTHIVWYPIIINCNTTTLRGLLSLVCFLFFLYLPSLLSWSLLFLRYYHIIFIVHRYFKMLLALRASPTPMYIYIYHYYHIISDSLFSHRFFPFPLQCPTAKTLRSRIVVVGHFATCIIIIIAIVVVVVVMAVAAALSPDRIQRRNY